MFGKKEKIKGLCFELKNKKSFLQLVRLITSLITSCKYGLAEYMRRGGRGGGADSYKLTIENHQMVVVALSDSAELSCPCIECK